MFDGFNASHKGELTLREPIPDGLHRDLLRELLVCTSGRRISPDPFDLGMVTDYPSAVLGQQWDYKYPEYERYR